MGYTNIRVSKAVAETVLYEQFAIKGIAFELPGEIDFNFRIQVEGEDRYILKISRPEEALSYLEYQQQLLHFAHRENDMSPKVLTDFQGNDITCIKDKNGEDRYVRLLTWVPGRLWHNVNPKKAPLRYSLGEKAGQLTRSLRNFMHPEAKRPFQWDIAQGLWTEEYLHLFSEQEKIYITYFQKRFKENQSFYGGLRKSVVHNDVNDFNTVVSDDLVSPKVKAIIDFGDAVYTQIINDVAVTCTYAIMETENPLAAALPIVKGYQNQFELKTEELSCLYDAIAMRLVISVTKSAINKQKEPDNTYLLISEKPAWRLLKKWYEVSFEYAYYSFRNVCGYSTHPNADKFTEWAKKQQLSLQDLFPTLTKEGVHTLDLSVGSLWLGNYAEFDNVNLFDYKFKTLQAAYPDKILAGGYLEARTVYTSEDYKVFSDQGRAYRTIHLGIDFWIPEETPVYSVFDGRIVTIVNNNQEKGYGGLIIVTHQVEDVTFYMLYGHLSLASIKQFKKGDIVQKGTCIGYIGNKEENGGWIPHLHFQLMLSLLDYEDDFPGVADYTEISVWKDLCPSPNVLFNIKELETSFKVSNQSLIRYRKNHIGENLSLQYDVPIQMVRGEDVYLIDQFGNKYLDTVNNVAHVGHEHPEVVRAAQRQLAVLNTNTRYLHENLQRFSQELLETMPSELSVVYLVNSGSEANELAMRMIKANTGSQTMIASEVGYHGNTNACIDISSYKFDGKGGTGIPEHTHIIPLPDTFRGKYTGENAGEQYANEVLDQITKIKEKGGRLGGFIIEPIISCGGQIELPEGFLKKAYQYVREAGGLCISDEVQTGCGRLGTHFWGFQLHGVLPDIVTIGKPLGNGHPVAAVVCTPKVAEKFVNGMEYFNTFGGNPVSCAVGTTVLQLIKKEQLQENARKVGGYLKEQLQLLASDFPIIGDVRGKGLFVGFELVNSSKEPLQVHASYLVNRMRAYKILMSTEGLDNNVIKIKPSLTFSTQNVDELLFYLRKILKEDFMQVN